MALQLPFGIEVLNPLPVDEKYLKVGVPYTSILDVNTTIPIGIRHVGLTVNISGDEYWYKNGINDVDLVVKSSGGGGSGERIEKQYGQLSHGFILGDVVGYNSNTSLFEKVQSVVGELIEPLGVVTQIPSSSGFTLTYAGYVNGLSTIVDENSNPITGGTTYFLSPSVAGKLTPDSPININEISKPILTTLTNDDALIFQYRGAIINEPITGDTTATTVYIGASPSNITVGGMTSGTSLTGRTFSSILEEILVTTFFPTLIAPSNTFNDDQANTQEVGVTLSINFTATFNRGSINPQYPPTASSFRSGPANTYNYTGTGLPATVSSTANTDNQLVTGYTLLVGANNWTNTVSYDAGVQPYDSAGNPYNSPLPSGTTGSDSTTITGIYPWFYGTSASINPRPTAGSALLATGTKVVASSNGTVNALFNTSGAEWTWVAIPTTSTVKTVWYVTALNNGVIGGTYPSGNKYPAPTSISVNSPTALWSGVNYNFYISEGASIETNVEFRNS